MTDLAMWTLIVGTLLPPLIAAVQQPTWSSRTRSIVTVGTCLVAGFGTAWLGDALRGVSLVTTVLTVLVTALATYQGFWKPTGIAPTVESLTSGTNTPTLPDNRPTPQLDAHTVQRDETPA